MPNNLKSIPINVPTSGRDNEPKSEKSPSNNEVLQTLQIDMLQSYKNHPFKPYDDKRFNDMVQSIRDNGVMTAIIVRPLKNGKYEILSGHNRVNAAKVVGIKTISSIVRSGLTDDDAELFVTETNLIQRSFTDMSHSERALAIAARHKAMKHQGKSVDLLEEIDTLLNSSNQSKSDTSSPMAKKLTSIDKIGKAYALSKDTVARYLRINKLINPHKERLDNNKLAIRVAVSLSYLSDEEQYIVDDALASKMYTVSMKDADLLRKASQEGLLNRETIEDILSAKKKSQSKYISDFKLKTEIASQYFTNIQNTQEIEDTILKALEYYFAHNNAIEHEGERNERNEDSICT